MHRPLILWLTFVVAAFLVLGCGSGWLARKTVEAVIPADVKPNTEPPFFLKPFPALAPPATGPLADVGKRIDLRDGYIRALQGELAKVKTEQDQDKTYQAKLETERLKTILYGVAIVCAVLAAIALVLSFLPALALLSGNFRWLAVGLGTVGIIAYGAAPLLIYVKWLIGSVIVLGVLSGVWALLNHRKVVWAAKANAWLADRLKTVDPRDSEALQAVLDEAAALQDRLGIKNVTEAVRTGVVHTLIPDKAFRKAQDAKAQKAKKVS